MIEFFKTAIATHPELDASLSGGASVGTAPNFGFGQGEGGERKASLPDHQWSPRKSSRPQILRPG
jgi:hypothetical protein